jgi:hypothetical protein
MEALTAAAGSAAAAKVKTSRGRSNARTPAASRSTSQAPSSPSSVLPSAMPSEVATEPAVVTFTTKAPTATAGHARRPSRSSAASAIPVGGHTAVALACTEAKSRPSLPATT